MNSQSSSPKDHGAQQLPLNFGHAASTARDDLIVSSPVDAAISLIDRWPDWPSPVVIMAGPTGSGKTHLANIWKERASALVINDLRSDDSTLHLAIDGPVLMEDIDREDFSETALFHLLNTVYQNNSHMLITSRTWPAAWPVNLPDLRSRLKAATVVEIGEPDDMLLAQVIEKLFSDRQIAIDPKIVSYLVHRMERSLAAAQVIVHKVDELALARRGKITRALVAEVLGQWDSAEQGEERG
ncbi:MAG: DnaA regulatory inactivator HdaA [Alphaproteobacteria bacterium]|nr:DnaA regulatory inactivator HdaA [Alphaproteobacteria bacterium]